MRLVVEYHEELETDLLPHHDLLDVWRGRMSWRRLELLIRHLPADSGLVRALNPDLAVVAAWTVETEVQAAIFDAIMHANFQDPQPFPRPQQQIEQRNRAEARRAALERQRDRVNARNQTTKRG